MNSTRTKHSLHRDGARWGVSLDRLRHDESWRMNLKIYEFLGLGFMPLTLDQTLTQLGKTQIEDGFRYVVTPNVDHMVRLWREPDLYKPLYDGAGLVVCDSRILEVMARLSGIPLSPVPGSDLTARLFEDHIRADEPVNIIGGDVEIAETLKSQFGLKKLNQHIPPMGLRKKPEAVQACADFIADHPARFTFICVGSPQQEMVAQAALKQGDYVGVGLCVGASLDFLTGRTERAPLWMQEARLEWLHRLWSEPGRLWKRYLLDGPKIFGLWVAWMCGKTLKIAPPEQSSKG